MLPIVKAERKPYDLSLTWFGRRGCPDLLPSSTSHLILKKTFLRLPKHIQALATRKDQWFRKDAFDARLRTPTSAYWAYSVNREYRVLFCFLGSHEVIYYDVGTHQIYG